jgi:hypothetical protein
MNNKKIIDELYLCAAQCTHCYDACAMEKYKDLQRWIALEIPARKSATRKKF